MNNQSLKTTPKLIITIDGPAASGKGTAAYRLAREFGWLNLDSGACYRAVAWLGLEHGVRIDEAHVDELVALLEKYPLELIPNPENSGPKCFVKMGGRDITELIRTPQIDEAASVVGALPSIRSVVRELTRQIAFDSSVGIIVEGRDTGTVVFPEADLKFFLNPSLEDRAHRRFMEYVERGKQVSREQIAAEIAERDERDMSRAYSPLRVPVDAIVVDSTGYEIEQTVGEIRGHILRKLVEVGGGG
jgi:CMP/dCMP kinase